MNTQTGKMLATSWNIVRDAGSAMTDAAANSRVGTSLVRSLPRVKELVTFGAALALARRGSRIAIAAVRRNPVAAIAGAVALAGVGLAITVARRRKQARENGDGNDGSEARAPTRRLAAKKMHGSNRVAADKVAPRAADNPAAHRHKRLHVRKNDR